MSKMTDEEIDKKIIEVLAGIGSEKLWKNMTHNHGPYDISRPNAETTLFARALLSQDAEIIADHRRLVRELDVILNGDGAAEQASLCDIVAQLRKQKESAASAVPDDYALVLIDRNYDARAKQLIAFNTCNGDLDDKLEAAHKAMLAAGHGLEAMR